MKADLTFLEALEDRIAPAAVTTFTDIDGDTVQVSSSKGTKADLDAALTVTMGQLELVDVTAALFKGANITIKVIERGLQGDGSVNVGVIDGTGVDLGKVIVGGDLGQILAGDSEYKTAGLKGLYVNSMGVQGTNTGATDFVSDIHGAIGTVKILGDLYQAGIYTHNGASAGPGDIKSVYIGGNMVGGDMDTEGAIRAEGNLGKVFVGGDIIGGSANYSGSLSGNAFKALTIQGDMVATTGATYSGMIFAGSLGKTYIGGSIYGSDTDASLWSGSIYVGNGTKSLEIGGSVVGGMGNNGGRLNLNGVTGSFILGGDLIGGDGDTSGNIRGNFDKAVIKGSLIGGTGLEAGGILAQFRDMTIFGSLRGGAGQMSGTVFSNDQTPTLSLKIHGDLIGSSGNQSGSIRIDGFVSDNLIGDFWIGGSVQGSNGSESGAILLKGQVGSLYVGGDLKGGSTSGAGSIYFYGGGAVKVVGDVVGGSASGTGYIQSVSADVGVKSLEIGGDLIGGSANSTGWVTIGQNLGTGLVGGDFHGTNDRTNTARFTVVGDVTGKMSVGGTLFGADRTVSSAHLDVQGYAKEIAISGSIIGGAANNGVDTYINSGSVTVGSAGKITLQGSLIGGHQSGGSEVQNHGAIRVAKTIDSLVIKGNVERGAGAGGVVALITAGGDYQAGDKSNLAFGSILIGGSVKQGMILSGYGLTGTGLNGSGAVANGSTAQIGNVTVNGNWITSTLAAGATTGATIYFSSATTTLLPAVAGSDIQATVASMVVKGSLQGTMGANTNGVVAERFLKFSVGGLDITPGPGNFNEHFGSMNYGMRWQQTSVHAA